MEVVSRSIYKSHHINPLSYSLLDTTSSIRMKSHSIETDVNALNVGMCGS